MRSHLLHGVVRHRRARPFAYELRARRLLRRPRPRRAGRRRPLAAPVPTQRSAPGRLPRRRPPASRRPRDVRSAFRDHLVADGEDPRGWRITLIANLRVAGYVFDPASFFLCRDGDGVLRVVVVEVHNTHGERHLYTLRPRDGDSETFVGRDGQGVLRVAVHRACTAATRCGSATSRRGCGSRSTSASPRASSCTPAWTWRGGG